MVAVFKYLIGNNGTEAALTYGLKDVQYPCQFNSTRTAALIKSYGTFSGNEDYLKRALASIGPLAVGLNGRLETFYNYGKGVYDDLDCDGDINHAGVLVGYGVDYSYLPPKNYWIIKNSWGKSW